MKPNHGHRLQWRVGARLARHRQAMHAKRRRPRTRLVPSWLYMVRSQRQNPMLGIRLILEQMADEWPESG